MGWFDDLKGATKSVGRAIGGAAAEAGDFLVDQDAWKNTYQAIADGPGGKELSGSDIANVLLDASMLVPGVGLAGGAARLGAKAGTRVLAKEAAEKVAERTVNKTLLRSPANNAVRGMGDMLVGGRGKGAAIRAAMKEGGEGAAKKSGNKLATSLSTAGKRKTSDVSRNQLSRMAAKQQAGIGRRVGFGQTKKRMIGNTIGTVGANAGATLYDMLNPEQDIPQTYDTPTRPPGPPPLPPTDVYGDAGRRLGGGGGGGMTIADLMRALAEYQQQNGNVNGNWVQTLRA